MMKRIIVYLYLLTAIPAFSQLRLVPDATGNKVFVWLERAPRQDEQYHVYRKTGNGVFLQLTESPIASVTSGAELVAKMGLAFEGFRKQLDETDPQAVFLRLQADRFRAKLYGYALPELGLALGQLFVDEKAPNGETATYKVEGVNGQGEPRGQAMTGTVHIHPEIPPAPENLSATHEGPRITLKWDFPQSTDDMADQVVRFEVQRQAENGKFVAIQDAWLMRDANQTRHAFIYSETGMTQMLRFQVVAVNVAGTQSAGSNVFPLALKDNAPPEVLEQVKVVVSKKGNEATVTFPSSTDPQLAGYFVYRSTNIEKNFVRMNDKMLGPLQTVYTDKTLKAGTTYYYRVTVVDASGNESKQSNAVMAEGLDKTPPPPPQNLKAAVSPDRKINLFWQIPAQTEDLLAYVLLRRQVKTPPELFSQLTSRNFVGNQFVDEDLAKGHLSEGVQYEYVVTAMDKKQNFSDSARVVLDIKDLTPPASPLQITAENIDGRYISVSYGASLSPDVAHYELFRQNGNGPLKSLQRVHRQAFPFRDEAVIIGETYTYYVIAVDAANNASKPTVSQAITLKDNVPPPVVQNVQSRVEAKGVRIRWEKLPTTDLARYRIYRTSGLPTGIYQLVAETDPSTSEWVDLKPPEKGYYHIRALDTAGNESLASLSVTGK